MKKLILLPLLSIALLSCKKTTSMQENTSENKDSISVVKPEMVKLKEKSVAEMSNFLQTKNDTLYITNFFATWCGPCVNEIPHFKEKIAELKNQPVKITFVSLDNKDVWETELPQFVDEHGIRNNTIIVDGQLLDEKFFSSNFKEWTGSAIPFTFMRKGDKTVEVLGMVTPEELNTHIASFNK